MKRCLIVIGNEGPANIFLPGVRADVENYLAYFRSDHGGAWENDEIEPLNFGWNKDLLYSRIYSRRMDKLDYALIVFVGHGYAERDGQVYFELSPNNEISLDEIKSYLQWNKVLMIADSCQTYLPGNLNEGAEQREFCISEQRIELKKRYNHQISEMLSYSFIFASAVSLGQAANEDSRGGLYSRCLLSHARSIAGNSLYGEGDVVDISLIHSMARETVLQQSRNRQSPCLSMFIGVRYPPFYVK